jgi:hypothetical protein
MTIKNRNPHPSSSPVSQDKSLKMIDGENGGWHNWLNRPIVPAPICWTRYFSPRHLCFSSILSISPRFDDVVDQTAGSGEAAYVGPATAAGAAHNIMF